MNTNGVSVVPPGKVSSREVRAVVNAQGKALAGLLPAVQALANNDRLVRSKMEGLERRMDGHEAFEMRTLWERIRWICCGR